MTLVVGRVCGPRVAVAADTLVTEHDVPLPVQRGTVKSCLLPGDVCVSFSNSPELANLAFSEFAKRYPAGATFAEVVTFFERSSSNTGNDYLIAFSRPARLVKVSDGQRRSTPTDTAWIGDAAAYSHFREYGQRKRQRPQAGRAINAAYFADEIEGSPASDLFSAMRNVALNADTKSVGGFVSVVSNRDNGFRHSVYSDMLFDWPLGQSEDYAFRYEDPVAFRATNENSRFAIAQISSGYMGLNAVAFYAAKASKLFFFYGKDNALPSECRVFDNVTADKIAQTLTAFVGADLGWLLTVTSPRDALAIQSIGNGKDGSQFAFVCEANTFPPTNA